MRRMLRIFDPQSWLQISFNWLELIICVFLIGITRPFWVAGFWSVKFKLLILEALKNNLKSLYEPLYSPGILILPITIFVLILWNNFIRLFPYVFSTRSHPQFRISIAFPIWIGYMLFSFLNQFNQSIAHFVPRGRPLILVPLLVLIEVVRRVIRPLTLCIRLTANMVAGHLLLRLVASGISLTLSLAPIFVILSFLIILELRVSLIQSYVFSSLVRLYFKEANTKLVYYF